MTQNNALAPLLMRPVSNPAQANDQPRERSDFKWPATEVAKRFASLRSMAMGRKEHRAKRQAAFNGCGGGQILQGTWLQLHVA